MNKFNQCALRERVATLVATFFYVGNAPYMPGTVASFATAAIFFFIPMLALWQSIALTAVLLLVGVWVSCVVEEAWQIKDPSRVVIDEVLGMTVALCMLPKVFWVYAMAFVLFRIFDISKLYPINLIEKNIHGGWGIMLDDLLAGLEAGFIALVVCHLMG